MQKLIQSMKDLPIGIVGTSMSLLPLGALGQLYHFPRLQPILLKLAFVGLLLYGVKLVVFPKKVWQDLQNPLVASFYPTLGMLSFFLVYQAGGNWPLGLRQALWFGILFIYIIFIVFFVLNGLRLGWWQNQKVAPSWFIVFVGPVAAVCGAEQFLLAGMLLPWVILWSGILCYGLMYSYLMYQAVKGNPYLTEIGATVGVLAAPASLCLVGYLKMTATPMAGIVSLLALTSVLNLCWVYFKLPSFLLKDFLPNYAAFTFPLANSALAMALFSQYLMPYFANLSELIRYLAIFEGLVASVVIGFIVVSYLRLGVERIRQEFD